VIDAAQMQRIDSISKRITLPESNKYVLKAVRIQVVDTYSPGPKVFHSNLV